MKRLLLIAGVIALAGCASVERLAPQTVGGYKAGGIIGAVDGLSGAVLARCELADGQMVRVALDLAAEDIGKTRSLESIREERQELCRRVQAARNLGTLVLTAPPPKEPE